MTAQEDLARRIERDTVCRAVQKKIDEGKADFSDTARYTDRAAELLGEVLAAYVPDMPPEERETLCKGLLRQRYLDTNAMLNAVQRTLDAAQGLHLAPQIADYPEERVDQAAHSLADETVPVETIVRRAKSAPATIARSFHDDYIEKNAAFRDSAGLKCYITRNAVAKCCEWCTKMAGRYRYGEEPEDVYRRHDNCSCTVTYENGRKRQDVWSKREWEAPKPGAGAGERVVLTKEQAEKLQVEHGLTYGRKPAIIKNIELPPETDQIRSMSAETKQLVSDAIDKIMGMYEVQLDQLITEPIFKEDGKTIEKTVPFQFQPRRGKDGELVKCIVINSMYDFMGNQEEMQARIMRNFTTGVLASNSIEGLIAHEMAHVITFQDIYTYSGYLIENKSIAERFVSGISIYADSKYDGSECIAEAFAAKICGQPISQEAQKLLDEFIERRRKHG